MADDLYWDPYDKAIDRDPHPVWRRMRDERPVYRNDKFDFYALSRFEDVDAASLDAATYSSKYGTVLEIMGSEPYPEGGPMIFLDPPKHTTLRTLVSRAFTPRRVGELEDVIRATCADLLDPYVGAGGFDYVQDFATQLPSMIISQLIGIDPADREEIRRTIDETFHHDETSGMINEKALNAVFRLQAYYAEQLEARRSAPRDDLMTALIQAEIRDPDGTVRRLTLEEATQFTGLLTSAGTETVARLLGWAGYLLAEHPDRRAELVADPSLIPNALEETLRYEAPSPVQGRTLTRDVDLHGTHLPAGSRILLLTGSAGRDERKYADADVYDIHRRVDNQLSFGRGIHFCLGAGLARLESRIAMEETLKRFPTWDVDHAAAVRLYTSTVRGYDQLPITT